MKYIEQTLTYSAAVTRRLSQTCAIQGIFIKIGHNQSIQTNLLIFYFSNSDLEPWTFLLLVTVTLTPGQTGKHFFTCGAGGGG